MGDSSPLSLTSVLTTKIWRRDTLGQWVFTSTGEQDDTLKEITMDKTLDNTTWRLRDRNQYQIVTELIDDKGVFMSLHRWCQQIQEMSDYGGQEIGSTKGVEEVVDILTESVVLLWFVWFVSKHFVNVCKRVHIMRTITDYQLIVL